MRALGAALAPGGFALANLFHGSAAARAACAAFCAQLRAAVGAVHALRVVGHEDNLVVVACKPEAATATAAAAAAATAAKTTGAATAGQRRGALATGGPPPPAAAADADAAAAAAAAVTARLQARLQRAAEQSTSACDAPHRVEAAMMQCLRSNAATLRAV